ncbi:MAG: dienelactone hydrolase family protein [Firmicutes bacterium]|nr:dienelactone hydrolase family protein [Bacillota bacterium]
MLTYLNNSRTAVIVLHEIYGVNKHIAEACKKIAQNKVDVFCPNILENKPYTYDQEEVAYENFINNVGFTKVLNETTELLKSMRSQYDNICVVGFSVGATVGWLCSENSNLCDAVIGFYGSRIRNYLDVVPKCPVLLLFPSQEKSFEVDPVVESLSKKNNVTVKKLSGKHGFADPYSKNYNVESYQEAYKDVFSLMCKMRGKN